MTSYSVTWEIDIEADSHEEAAAKALAIHRDPDSTATIFYVKAGPCEYEMADGERLIDATTGQSP